MAISVGKLGGSSAGSVGHRVGVDSIGDAEREAFERLYREFLPRVAGYVRRHVHDYELVDEIVQETLLRAYRHGLHREAGDEHWRWLSTVARNLCIDQRALHRNWRECTVEEPETLDLTVYESDPEAHVVAAERQEIVARALERLSERERRLLVQKHVEGRRVREMASLEGVHVEALKSALRRARSALRESYAAITDKTGVASVFGTIAAAAGLRLRELKARIAATGDQVTSFVTRAGGSVRSFNSGLVALFGAATPVVAAVAAGTMAVIGSLLPSDVPATQASSQIDLAAEMIPADLPATRDTRRVAVSLEKRDEPDAGTATDATAADDDPPTVSVVPAPADPGIVVDEEDGSARYEDTVHTITIDPTTDQERTDDGTRHELVPVERESDYDGDGSTDGSFGSTTGVNCSDNPDDQGKVMGATCLALGTPGSDHDAGLNVL